jgi:hypothetical protein
MKRNENLLNSVAFSKQYRISRSSVYKLLREGLLPIAWVGKRRLIDCISERYIQSIVNSVDKPGYWSRTYTDDPPKKRKNETFDQKFDREFAEWEKTH